MVIREYTDKKFNTEFKCNIDFDRPLEQVQDTLDTEFDTATTYISYSKADVVSNSREAEETGDRIIVFEITTIGKNQVYFGISERALK